MSSFIEAGEASCKSYVLMRGGGEVIACSLSEPVVPAQYFFNLKMFMEDLGITIASIYGHDEVFLATVAVVLDE
jgi:hypothetical protein